MLPEGVLPPSAPTPTSAHFHAGVKLSRPPTCRPPRRRPPPRTEGSTFGTVRAYGAALHADVHLRAHSRRHDVGADVVALGQRHARHGPAVARAVLHVRQRPGLAQRADAT